MDSSRLASPWVVHLNRMFTEAETEYGWENGVAAEDTRGGEVRGTEGKIPAEEVELRVSLVLVPQS